MQFSHDKFFFPEAANPHTDFGAKHAFMMATINSEINAGKTSFRILEIGSWLGASTLLWAESIRQFGNDDIVKNSKIISVDSWNPIFCSDDMEFPSYKKFVGAAKDDVAYKIFCHNACLGSRKFGVTIDHIRGRSDDVLPDICHDTFDIAYIDAGHYYDDVIVDIAFAKDLVASGGIICGDDLNIRLDQADLEVVRANANRDYIYDRKSGGYYHPGVTLAVGESFPAVGACGGFWSVRKVSDQVYLPSEIAFNGIFIPSFLGDNDQKSFVEIINTYRNSPGT